MNNFLFAGIALGDGPVRPLIGYEPSSLALRGTGELIAGTSTPPWLAIKTLWFSTPAYQGPFVVRVERLGRTGPVALGGAPAVAPLVVPPGPTQNGGEGWREATGGTWVRSPGCYAWQVDSLKYSEIIVIRLVLP